MNSSPKPTISEKISVFCHHKNPFINKLFDLVENNREPEVITWSPQGNAFIVYNREVFSNRILPNLFSHKNLSSFTRQLNMYDFKRCKASRGKLSYSHPYFKKGRGDLLKNIKRNRKSMKSMDIVQEPGPTYEELLKSNEELRTKQETLERKLKLSYRLISTLLRKGNTSTEKISELTGAETPFVESENTDIPSQINFEQSSDMYSEFEAVEPSPRKLVFQDYDKQFQGYQKVDERSPGEYFRSFNFSNVLDVSPFNFDPMNVRKFDTPKAQDPMSWDAVMSDMMLTGSN